MGYGYGLGEDEGDTDAEIEQGWGIPSNPVEFKLLDWAAKGYAAEQARKTLPQKKVAPNGLKIGKPQAEGSKASVAVRQLAVLGKTATTARSERQRLDALTQLYERGAPTRRN